MLLQYFMNTGFKDKVLVFIGDQPGKSPKDSEIHSLAGLKLSTWVKENQTTDAEDIAVD